MGPCPEETHRNLEGSDRGVPGLCGRAPIKDVEQDREWGDSVGPQVSRDTVRHTETVSPPTKETAPYK